MPHATASRIAVGLAALLLAASGLASCGGDQPDRPAAVPATTAASTTAAGPPRPVTAADAKRCPVTLPGNVGPSGVSPGDFSGGGSSYGHGKL